MKLAMCLFVSYFTLMALAVVTAQSAYKPKPDRYEPQTYSLLWVARADRQYRRARACETAGGLPITKNPRRYRLPHSVGYRRLAWRRWKKRAQWACTTVYHPIAAIYYVFGPYAGQAVEVARCETGGTFWTGAHNGQYLGLFQMGEYARSRYGHSSHALGQARAAYRYFVDAGGWGPWECKP